MQDDIDKIQDNLQELIQKKLNEIQDNLNEIQRRICVPQGAYYFHDGSLEKTPVIIGSFNASPCCILTTYDSESHSALVAHIDPGNKHKLLQYLELIEKLFPDTSDKSKFEFHFASGPTFSQGQENFKLFKSSESRVVILEQFILEKLQGDSKQIKNIATGSFSLINTQTGKFYADGIVRPKGKSDYKGPFLNMDNIFTIGVKDIKGNMNLESLEPYHPLYDQDKKVSFKVSK